MKVRFAVAMGLLFAVLTSPVVRADGIAGANTTTWIATESTLVSNATTQLYELAFNGPSTWTIELSCSSFSPPHFNCLGGAIHDIHSLNGNILNFPGATDFQLESDNIWDNIGGSGAPRTGCSSSFFPPCEPGIVNVYSATETWFPFGLGGPGTPGIQGFSLQFTLLDSFPSSPSPEQTPEPSSLLLMGTGVLGIAVAFWKRRNVPALLGRV